MEYTGEPGLEDIEASWIIDGPNSGGIRRWILWQGHVFLEEHEGCSSTVSKGIPVGQFIERYSGADDPVARAVAEDLRRRERG